LGWLDVAQTTAPEINRILALGDAVKAEGIHAVYLLGMGGSSLCAEVIASVFGGGVGYPRLTVLDTTDERTITTAAKASSPRETLFIVASKSGGTVEVSSMERFFWQRMVEATAADAGCRSRAVIAKSFSIPPTSAAASPRCLFSGWFPRR
jgi:glucose-6-phosphate isomerase